MSRPLLNIPPATGVDRGAATVSLAAAAVFVLLLAGLHVTQPELDPTWRFMSEYALGPTGWMLPAAFSALAASLLGVAVALRRQVRTWPGRIGLGLLVIAVIGLLMAAVFPTDPITTSVADQSVTGLLHQLGASLDWSPVGMLLITWALGRTADWRPLRPQLLAAAGVSCGLTLVFGAVAAAAGGAYGPGTYAGLLGRVLLLSYLGWLVIVAVRVRHTGVGSPERSPSLVAPGDPEVRTA